MILAEIPKTPLERKIEHTHRLFAMEEKALEEGVTEDHEHLAEHYHCNGCYVRAFTLPEGYWATGEVHRFACINIVAKGHVKVVQSDGEYELRAGDIYISQPGEKKALYAFEETVFCNVHATEETDQEILRGIFTVPKDELLEFQETLKLEDK